MNHHNNHENHYNHEDEYSCYDDEYDNNGNEYNNHEEEDEDTHNHNPQGSDIISYAEGFLHGLQQEQVTSQNTITAAKHQISALEAEVIRREQLAETEAGIQTLGTLSALLDILKPFDDSGQVEEMSAALGRGLKIMNERRHSL